MSAVWSGFSLERLSGSTGAVIDINPTDHGGGRCVATVGSLSLLPSLKPTWGLLDKRIAKWRDLIL